MTTPDPKTAPARRTYASLEGCRGFVALGQAERAGVYAMHVMIGPMTRLSEWRHVGGSRWDAKDALYEEVGL